MSGFSGINNFGSLTTSNGQRLTFKDFDKNDDGVISEQEYNQVLKDCKLDAVDLSTVDNNGDKEISEQEFNIWEQKQEMQNAVNAYASTIAFDFAGDKSKYIPELTSALKDSINDYADNFTGSISDMAKMFTQKLPEIYDAICAQVLANDTTTIATKVVNEIIAEMPAESAIGYSAYLDRITQSFIKSYTGNNFEADFRAYVDKSLNMSDAEKLSGSIETYQSRVEKLGSTIETGELDSFKEAAKQLLMDALKDGIEVKLGSQKVSSTNITAVLNKYTDGNILKTDIQNFIDNLNTVNKSNQILASETEKADTSALKTFTDIPGDAYKINASLIDISKIDGYSSGKTVTIKKSGSTDSVRQSAKDSARATLDGLKDQIKSQITSMLQAKGVSFDLIENIFENTFSNTAIETVEECVSGRNRTAFRKAKFSYNVKTLVDTFIEKFNTNISTAINEKNASDKDYDTLDFDFTQAGKDENGKPIIDSATGADLSTLYSTGKTITANNKTPNYFMSIAEQMIDRMKAQVLRQAKAMCTANGVTFDEKSFTTLFNNAKSYAVNTSVTTTMTSVFNRSSSLNTKNLLNSFNEQFKLSITDWVENEKAKGANK